MWVSKKSFALHTVVLGQYIVAKEKRRFLSILDINLRTNNTSEPPPRTCPVSHIAVLYTPRQSRIARAGSNRIWCAPYVKSSYHSYCLFIWAGLFTTVDSAFLVILVRKTAACPGNSVREGFELIPVFSSEDTRFWTQKTDCCFVNWAFYGWLQSYVSMTCRSEIFRNIFVYHCYLSLRISKALGRVLGVLKLVAFCCFPPCFPYLSTRAVIFLYLRSSSRHWLPPCTGLFLLMKLPSMK